MKTKWTRKAIYTGRRHDIFSGQILHRFELLPDKKEMFFAKTRGCYVGYTYKCSATQMPRKPEMADDPRVENAAWQGADAAAGEFKRKRLEKARSEKKIAQLSKDKITEAVNAILPLIQDIELPSDEHSLVNHLHSLARKKKLGFKK